VVLGQLDKLVDPLEKTLTARLKGDAVKQEVRAAAPDAACAAAWALVGALRALPHAMGVGRAPPSTRPLRRRCAPCRAQVDRHEELLRSCLRAVDALHRLPGAEGNAAFTAFLKRTVGNPQGTLKEKYALVQQERMDAEDEGLEPGAA
jgi:hypothetical protein